MRLVHFTLARFVYSGFIVILSGCGSLYTVETEVRNLPCEVEVELTRGDKRQEVHSLLGEPLIEAQRLGVEVYRDDGRDTEYLFPFIPVPGARVSGITLLTYDDNEIVKELATGLWRNEDEFWITAGGFGFVNVDLTKPPETLLAPPISWESLTGMKATEDRCMLILLMGECPMDEISLDEEEITDLWPSGFYCEAWEQRQHNLYGAFIRRDISSGYHQLTINQKSLQGKFKTNFECKGGEMIFAELKANITHDAWGERTGVEGAINISKTPPESAVYMKELRAILWHQGKWIDSPNNPISQ